MYAELPAGSKPTKSLSTDPTRPVLTHAELRETPDGWELVMADSYQLARIKLSVKGENEDEPLVAGAISTQALKAIEKSRAFRANGRIEPANTYGTPTGESFVRDDPGRFPTWDSLMPELEPDAFTIGLDAELLYKLAQSLGAKKHARTHVAIKFVMKDGKPNALRPMTVTSMGDTESIGILMPVRAG